MDLHNARRQVGAERQDFGLLKEAGSDDHVCRLVIACGCRDSIPAVHRFHCQGACPETDRRLETRRISLQVADDLVARQESVRLIACILVSGQAQLPVGRDQRKRVPPLVAPGSGEPGSLLENQVRSAIFLEAAARGEPGLSSADNDCVYLLWHGALPPWQYSTNNTHDRLFVL